MKIPNKIAEIKVSYSTYVMPSERVKISSSADIHRILRENWDHDTIEFHEEFKIILLNRANHVLGIYNLSKGGVAGTVADPKNIFSIALKTVSSGIILAHNHPSGNLAPSEADRALTRKIKEGGKILDIAVLDHIIYTVESYYSFADEGNM